jgi:hypothetical protein
MSSQSLGDNRAATFQIIIDNILSFLHKSYTLDINTREIEKQITGYKRNMHTNIISITFIPFWNNVVKRISYCFDHSNG